MNKYALKMNLTKKDILAMNQQFEYGDLMNEPSLDFAISYANKTNNWIKGLAVLTRAILVDHVFEEGNKRTALLLIKACAADKGYKVYDDKLVNSIKKIITKNIISKKRIEEIIENAIK